jgi:hypothetical protein
VLTARLVSRFAVFAWRTAVGFLSRQGVVLSRQSVVLWQAARTRLERARAKSAPVAASPELEVAAPVVEIAEQPAMVAAPASEPVAHMPPVDARDTQSRVPVLDRAIAALESGNDELAYQLFVQACHEDGRDPRAWFFRAKTAPTLKEVIASLERAAALAPDNDQIRVSLADARSRLERERTLRKIDDSTATAPKPSRPWAPRPVPAAVRFRRALANVATWTVSSVAAAACLLVGAIWLAAALPPEALGGLNDQATAVLQRLPQLDFDALRGTDVDKVALGYDPLSALPYALGFLAVLAGGGLLQRAGWARWWGPAVALASGALWLGYSSLDLPASALIALCSVAAVTGPLTPAAE